MKKGREGMKLVPSSTHIVVVGYLVRLLSELV